MMPWYGESMRYSMHAACFQITEHGPLIIYDLQGRKLLRSLKILTRTYFNNKVVKSLLVPHFSKNANGQDIAVVREQGWTTEIALRGAEKEPFICIHVSTTFHDRTVLLQQALVLDFLPKATQVFAKNGQLVKKLKKRTVLGHKGCIFGRGQSCVFIAHALNVSSLVLQGRQTLIANIDFWMDHPQITCKEDRTYRDASASVFQANDVLKGNLRVHAGFEPRIFPRILHTRSGKVAAHIWNEHACYTHLRLHKAIFFGREDIHHASESVGGFCGHNIPVTKSIFYKNKGKLNDGQTDVFKGQMPSFKSDPEFASFIKEVSEAGHEICLHSVQPGESVSEEINEALSTMKENFDSVSWIDHAAYSAGNLTSHSAPESVLAFGLVPDSPFYMIPLWRKYGIRYLWNATLEYGHTRMQMKKYHEWYSLFLTYRIYMIRIMKILWFRFRKYPDAQLRLLKPFLNLFGRDNDHISPYYFHPSYRLVFWNTLASYVFPKESTPYDPYADDALGKLIAEWGVCICHAYPTYVGDINGAWERDDSGRIISSQRFEDLLKRLKHLGDINVLENTTIKDYLTHNTRVHNVNIHFTPDSRENRIVNQGEEPIQGLTLAIQANRIDVSGGKYESKRHGNDFLVWFDLSPGESRTFHAS